MTTRHWNKIVGSAPGGRESVLLGREIAENIINARSKISTSPSAGVAIQDYLELSWLTLAQQEQADMPNESPQSRERRVFTSVAQRAFIQRMSADLFSVTGLTHENGTSTSVAGETSHKNQH